METSPATSTAQTSKVPFYINRNFALLWGEQAVSNIGDFVFQTTLVLWIAAIIAKGQQYAAGRQRRTAGNL